MYEMAHFGWKKRNFERMYENYPASDLANFGGIGGLGGWCRYGPWNGGFESRYYDLPGTVEQATRSHVEAQNDFEKSKEKYEEAKKKYEECEKKGT
jgi:F0F1-type ATP synthase membrane subunit b/b'